MAEETKTEQWLFTVASRRLAWGLVKLATAAKCTAVLRSLGITVDGAVLESAIQVSAFSALVLVHDWAKHRTGWRWL